MTSIAARPSMLHLSQLQAGAAAPMATKPMAAKPAAAEKDSKLYKLAAKTLVGSAKVMGTALAGGMMGYVAGKSIDLITPTQLLGPITGTQLSGSCAATAAIFSASMHVTRLPIENRDFSYTTACKLAHLALSALATAEISMLLGVDDSSTLRACGNAMLKGFVPLLAVSAACKGLQTLAAKVHARRHDIANVTVGITSGVIGIGSIIAGAWFVGGALLRSWSMQAADSGTTQA